MCRSMVDGGQRCAAHTKARLETASVRMREAVEHCKGPEDLTRFHKARETWEEAAAEYASTPTGRAALVLRAKEAEAAEDVDTAAMLNTVVRRGDILRETNDQVRAALKAAGMTEEGLPGERVSESVLVSDANGNGLSPREQEQWATLIDAVASSDSEEMERYLDSLVSADTSIAAAGTADADLAGAVRKVTTALETDPAYRLGDNSFDWARGRRGSRAASSHWQVQTTASGNQEVLLAQVRRAVRHPNAAGATYAHAKDYLPPDEILADPRCPENVISSVPDHVLESLSPSTWDTLRERRTESTMTAVLVARHDISGVGREEAQQQIVGTQWDTLNGPDMSRLRAALPSCLPEAQARLVEKSMVDWVQQYGDENQRLSVLSMDERNPPATVAVTPERGGIGFFRRD